VLAFFAAASGASAATKIDLKVNATGAYRHLLTSEMELDVEPGERAFWYPEWVPGVAGPTGQITNVAGVVFEDQRGKTLRWRRDSTRLNRFVVTVPPDCGKLRVKLTYLANQPTPMSMGVDTYGSRQLLALNFNTCLLYPEGEEADSIRVRLRVKLPREWEFGTALRAGATDKDGWVDFGDESLATVIDSPLIAGAHHKRLRFDSGDGPATTFHIVSDTPASLELSPERVKQLQKLTPEAISLLGAAPFPEYTFLVVSSDRVPRTGIEHQRSSLNFIRSEHLVEDELYGFRAAYLLPHELVHAWCGKHRLPAGMRSPNYHTPLDTELLWVYEGLTQYLMQLVAVRSGQVTLDAHLEYLAFQVADQMQRAGRGWRPLSDTAVSAPTLRAGSVNWNDLRRGQDYYDEGALFWLEVDCLLRERTGGERSIDDFCRAFFAAPSPNAPPRPYELEDVLDALADLAPDVDWRGMVNRNIYAPRPTLTLDGVRSAGYRLEWTDSKPDFVRVRESVMGSVEAVESLGLAVSTDGEVQRVAPGSAADTARVKALAKIVAVNKRAFSPAVFDQELELAARDGDPRSKIELIVREGDWFAVHQLSYHDGPRHAVLVPDDDAPDRFAEIFAKPATLDASDKKADPVRTAQKPAKRPRAS
jgi:predicted metalloprotease with PDZ domain